MYPSPVVEIEEIETPTLRRLRQARSSKGQTRYIPPISLARLGELHRVGAHAVTVGLLIWRAEKLARVGNSVKLTRDMLDAVGVTRRQLEHALVTLEAAGLVTVDRQSGRRPLVSWAKSGGGDG